MFQGCTALTTAPALPGHDTVGDRVAISHVPRLHSLTTAPALPATTLSTVAIHQCSKAAQASLSMPALFLATTLAGSVAIAHVRDCSPLHRACIARPRQLAHCYLYMFRGCTGPSLPACITRPRQVGIVATSRSELHKTLVNRGQLHVVDSSNESNRGLGYNVASSGTFTKPTALAEEYGTSRIPTGWTVVNKE